MGVAVGIRIDVGRVGVDVEDAVGAIDTGVEGPQHPVNNMKTIPILNTIRCSFSFTILTPFIVYWSRRILAGQANSQVSAILRLLLTTGVVCTVPRISSFSLEASLFVGAVAGSYPFGGYKGLPIHN
jgi:hypothetical protein